MCDALKLSFVEESDVPDVRLDVFAGLSTTLRFPWAAWWRRSQTSRSKTRSARGSDHTAWGCSSLATTRREE